MCEVGANLRHFQILRMMFAVKADVIYNVVQVGLLSRCFKRIVQRTSLRELREGDVLGEYYFLVLRFSYMAA